MEEIIENYSQNRLREGLGEPPGLVVNAEDSRSEPPWTWVRIPASAKKSRWKLMDHLMAEKLTKIIKTAKWGKSPQKNIFKKK